MNLRKFFGFFVLTLCLIAIFYAIIKQINGEFFGFFLLFPICIILFLFSLYFYFNQDYNSKKQMRYFALIAILIMLPFIGIKFYNYAFKEPSYLIGEIISAKKISNLDGNITKYIKPQILENIKSHNLEYLKSQGFSINSQNQKINACFNGIVKNHNFKILITIENNEVQIIAFSGYNAFWKEIKWQKV